MTNVPTILSTQNATCTSRRTVLSGAAALALATAALRMRSVLAEDGTPIASPVEEGDALPSWLFTQTFTSGDWEPTDDPAKFSLHLRGGLATTIGFTDRPNRDFAIAPTGEILPTIFEDATNPPNAAIIVEDAGTQYTFLLIVTDPVYDEAGDMVTYTVSVLNAYEGDGLGAAVERVADGTLPQSFGAGAIFIDSVTCWKENAKACRQVKTGYGCASTGRAAFNYLPDSVQTTKTCGCGLHCNCSCDQSYWNDWCNTTYPDFCYGDESEGCVFMTWNENWCISCDALPSFSGCPS